MLDHSVAPTSLSCEATAPLHLIVFTRYPEPGKTKTRLIPALGPEGAAAVQRQMTEWALAQARQLLQSERPRQSFAPFSIVGGLAVDVRFAGGTAAKMQEWLGSEWTYLDQGEGDLGDRLIRAFQSAFDRGAKAAIVIGIDCPGVTSDVLAQAYEQLLHNDGVIGPANDGGYYLIGLRYPIPAMFKGIDWGTETVRSSTLAIAETLDLKIAQLSSLSDVDRPEDLIVWQQISHQVPGQTMGRISIVIPVLNEAEHIRSTIQAIKQSANASNAPNNHPQSGLDRNTISGCGGEKCNHNLPKDIPQLEIIVVDGGSRDATMATAKDAGANVISSSPGRALQMNAGAAIATGEYILFLHADTQLPPNFPSYVRQTLRQPNTVVGAFELAIQGANMGLRLIEFGVKWRSRLKQMPYGDQAIFLKTNLFREVGGFPRLPLMEDFEFIRQMKRRGRVAIAKAVVTTSGRRWQRLGLLRTTFINQVIIVGYVLGFPIKKLALWYRQRT